MAVGCGRVTELTDRYEKSTSLSGSRGLSFEQIPFSHQTSSKSYFDDCCWPSMFPEGKGHGLRVQEKKSPSNAATAEPAVSPIHAPFPMYPRPVPVQLSKVGS